MSRAGQEHYENALRLEKTGDTAGAFEAFRRSAHADARVAAPYVGLARILMRNRQRMDAIACLQKAVACDPDDDAVRVMLGQALVEDGQLDAARSVFEAVLRKKVTTAEAFLGLGAVYEDLGDREAAADVYRRLLGVHPCHAEGFAGLLAIDDGETLIKTIHDARTQLQKADDPDAAVIGYALGKSLSRTGDVDGAFEAWSIANAARRCIAGPFDRQAFDRRISRLMDIFNSDFIADRRAGGAQSERPVFIVGLPRSGTTLTEQVLAAHPQVHGAGELDFLTDLATALPDRLGRADPPWPDAAQEMQKEHVKAVGTDYLDRIAHLSPEDRVRVIDKQPLNFWNLGLVACVLPNARIVHCRRDIRDCGLSIFSENFTPDQRWSTGLDDIAYYWRGYRRLMDHWRKASSLNILDLDYEKLVADPEDQSRRLLDFIGVPWDAAVLDFHNAKRAVQTPSRWQVRQPLYATSSGRWQAYQGWLGPLITAAAEEA